MSDIEIFLMVVVWIPAVVNFFIMVSNADCDDDEQTVQTAILWAIQLIVGILASVFHILLLPMAIVNVIIMAAAIVLTVSGWYFDFSVLFSDSGKENKKPKKDRKKLWRWILGLSAFFGLLYMGFWIAKRSMVKVDPGERAIKRSWGKIEPFSYEPGLVWYLPFTQDFGNEVIKVSTRPQRYGYNVPVRTKELQKVSLDCSVLLQLIPDSIHVLYDKYTGYGAYEEKVVRDMVQQTMLALSSQMSFWSFAEETNSLMTDAVEYIVNDQLMAQNLVKIEAFRLKGYQASPEVEALIEKTVQAHKNIELEQLKLEMAKIETEKVKQEAIQKYERLAAVAKANGIDVQIKAEALKNPFVAQYEMAKALQKWNGNISLPQTLMMMGGGSGNGTGASVLPIIPMGIK